MSARTETRTTIYECDGEHYRRRVVFGRPDSLRSWRAGRACEFRAGVVVAYEIVHGRRAFGCVFRTGAVDEESLAVPGVEPAVRMLIPFCKGRRFSRALALLQELDQRGVLAEISDVVLLRASVALSARVSTALLAEAITHREGRPWIS